jgi:murein DD-endopeptidase MepM/ murein hydrolase activator NlpD
LTLAEKAPYPRPPRPAFGRPAFSLPETETFMPRRHWTIMVVPDDQSKLRQYRVSGRLLRGGAVSLLLTFVVLSTLAAGYFVKENHRLESERLARANALLTAELSEIQGELATLESALVSLSSKDEQYRLLANLEPLDADVMLAGVGGPGSRTLAASPLWQVDRSLAELTFNASEGVNALIRRAQILASSWSEAMGALEDQVDVWERTPSIYPTRGYKTSGFNHARMHPILNVRRPHHGVDIAARRGTPVVATAKGTGLYAGDTRGDYGFMVDIDHGNGVVTRYAHLARGSLLVRRGQTVERWEKIAEVGATGLVTAPSIHYEVLVNGRPQNPDNFVVGDVIRF